MRREYMFMSLLIPGPKNPKGNIDVFLQPLIDELKELWEPGVEAWDASLSQNFRLRAAVMWTVNDFPAYGMLSGWTTAGRLSCPICMADSKAFQLKHGKKTSFFDCHRQFLPENHPWRMNKNWFLKNKVDIEEPPIRQSGATLLTEVSRIPKVTEQGRVVKTRGYGQTHHWHKQSIFWELPYWVTNLIRHNLDVMHIEKNVFDNVFNTVMDVKGKTKDNDNARRDVKVYCRRPEMELFKDGGKEFRRPARFTLNVQQRRALCEWVKSLRLPDGYASNLGRCVDMQKASLYGMKSHDCHVFMEQLLPIALIGLPEDIWGPLTELSVFFKEICSTTLTIDKLDIMEAKMPVILCSLERIFPPSFFDSMEHLPIHLVYEAKVGGPVQYRWMYPFERFLRTLKKKVTNKGRPEGSIVQAYLLEETATFCSHYFEPGVVTRLTRVPRHDDGGQQLEQVSIFNYPGRPSGKSKSRYLTSEEQDAAYKYIIMNCDLVRPHFENYAQRFRDSRPDITEEEAYEEFCRWFRDHTLHHGCEFENPVLLAVGWGPSARVRTWEQWYVNGFLFQTEELSQNKASNNSGVWVKGSDTPDDDLDYYGKLQEIIECEFPIQGLRLVLFKCIWHDPTPRGTRKYPNYSMVEVHKTRMMSVHYEPFIFEQQARQAYYTPYPAGCRRDKAEWLAVITTKARATVDGLETEPDDAEAFQVNEMGCIVPLRVQDSPPPLLVDAAAPEQEVEVVGTSKRCLVNDDSDDADEEQIQSEEEESEEELGSDETSED